MQGRIRRRFLHSAWIAGAAFSVAGLSPAGAQPLLPVGNQNQVNTVSVNFQQVPDVDRGAYGTAVAVWESYSSAGTDNSGRSVQARRFSVSGLANGDQFQVNTQTADEQVVPKVAVAPDGRFAVVWQSNDGGGGPANQEIRARFYSADGAPLGADFVANTFTTGDQRNPDVAWGNDEYFVVVWESDDDPSGAGFDWNIVGRLFSPAGAPLSAEFLFNTLAGEQLDPAVAALSNGDFVVAWESSTSLGPDSTTKSIQVRALGESAESQVNSRVPAVADDNPAIAVSPGGEILVVWESWGSDGDDNARISIQGRVLGASPTPVFQANSYTVDDQRFPSAAYLPDGRFFVAWQSFGSAGNDASEASVQVRGFAANGTPFGSDFQANSYTSNNQLLPAIATDGHGEAILVWESFGSNGGDDSGPSIQARRFSLDALLIATFEPGNLSEWSSVVP